MSSKIKLNNNQGDTNNLGDTTVDVDVLGLITKSFFTSLPTADPLVAGELWSNSGVVTISNG